MPLPHRVFACVLLPLLGGAALAQTSKKQSAGAPAGPKTPKTPAASKSGDVYAGEAVVVERLDTTYTYKADGTGTKLDTEVLRIQSEGAVRNFGVVSIPYASGTQRIEVVYLRVRKPEGTAVPTPPGDAQDQPAPVTQAAPFYSDLHLLQIPVRGLAAGDRLEYQVRTVLTAAEAPNQFWGVESFGNGAVVLERSVELRVPAAKYVAVSSPKFPAKTTAEGDETVYRWAGAQLNPTPKPAPEGQTPPEETAKDDDKLPPIAWTTFHSWAEVGEWYRGLAMDRTAITPSLKSRADSEVAGARTPDEKIQALYAYVSAHVRYIGVAFGIGRYQPHTAGEVLADQYGDCKDKHTLLAALLRAEGFPVSAVLIGGGLELNEAVPSPGAFNHLITLTGDAEHGDIWLDSTPEVAPFRMLNAELRDKPALVIPATGEPTLRRTPAELPFPSFTRFDATGTLGADGALKAHVDLTMRGDQELAFRQVLENVTPAQWDRVTQFYVQASGFSGNPSDTTADPPAKTATPLHVGYDYTRTPYGDWENFRVVPLQPLLILPLNERKSAPAKEFELGGPYTQSAVSRITLPAGYGAELPPAMHLHTEFAQLDKTYRLERAGGSDVLVTDRTLSFAVAKLPAAQWPAYRKFLDDIGTDEPWVQLTSTGATAIAGAHPPRPGENNPAAGDLVRQANGATEHNDVEAAVAKLDAAKALNPHQRLLWSSYGYAAQAAGKNSEAADDYRRELEAYPDEDYASHHLAEVLLLQGKTTEATAVLRTAVGRDPRGEQNVLALAALLARNDLPGAESTLRSGLSGTPGSVPLQLTLGHVLLREGKRDEGAKWLSAVATTSTDPDQLNDAAYALADASLNLTVAEQASRHSLGILNAATAAGETGIGSPAALRRAALLVASWDTFGWTLYKGGNYDEAEPWLRAGWADSYRAEPGLHFGLVLARQGRTAEALRVLHLAAAQLGRSTGETPLAGTLLSKTLREEEAALRAKVKVVLPDGLAEAHKEQTFAVARPPSVARGTAVFELEFANGAAPVARFAQGDAALAGLGAQLAKVDLRTSLPPGTSAHLLRRGVLTCPSGGSCSFIWLSAAASLTR